MNCFTICFKKHFRTNNKDNSIKNKNLKVKEISSLEDSSSKKRRRSKVRNLNSPNSVKVDKYNKPLYELKDKFRCLFCGGEKCKHEEWTRNKKTVVKGLNCDRVTFELFASQRPSTVFIEKYELVKQFKELNIGLIVNVQRQGEHPYCGPNKGLELISGFTYLPEAFTTEGIRVKLSGWKDMNVPNSIQFMLEIVKDMMHIIIDRKKFVLVHCHAGYGRTGIVLACYLIFTTNKTVDEIVHEIRAVRPGCIQKKSQLKYCKTFKEYIDRAREIFTQKNRDIEYFIKHQIDLSYGDDLNNHYHVPKILSVILNKIKKIIFHLNVDYLNVYQSINGSSQWIMQNENIIVDIKILMNKGKWEVLSEMDKESDINILIELCYDWLEDCVTYVINPTTIKKLFEGNNNDLHKEIEKNIESPDKFTKIDRRSLIEQLRNSLRLNEYETLIVIANFSADIFPIREDLNLKHEYNLMLQKLATYLLGYNIDIFMEGSVKLDRNVEDLIDKLTDILTFFIITIKCDNSIDDKLNIVVNPPRNESLQSQDNLNIKSDLHLKHLDNLSELQISSNVHEMISNKNSILDNQNSFQILNNKNETNKNEIEKDLILFEMYKSLEQYFKKKNSLMSQLERDYINTFYTSSMRNRLSATATNLKDFDAEIINDICNNFNKLLENKTNGSSINFKERFSLNSNYTNLGHKIIRNRINSENNEIIEINDLGSLCKNEIEIAPENKEIKHRLSTERMIKEMDEENINPSLAGTNIMKSNNIIENEIIESSIKKIKSSDIFDASENSHNPNSDPSIKSKNSLQESKQNSDKNAKESYKYIRPKSRNRTNSNFMLRFNVRESTMKAEYLSSNNLKNKIFDENLSPRKLIIKDNLSQDQ